MVSWPLKICRAKLAMKMLAVKPRQWKFGATQGVNATTDMQARWPHTCGNAALDMHARWRHTCGNAALDMHTRWRHTGGNAATDIRAR